MTTFKKYIDLFFLILRHGRWKHSGEDFNQKRNESLQNLQEFVPNDRDRNTILSNRKDSIFRNFIIQLAFFKNAGKNSGGHLTIHEVSYIRIPKSANTSMSNSMLEKTYPTLNQKSLTSEQINYLADVNLQIETTGYPAYFTVVRNPFHRLVSVYRDFFENKSSNDIYRDYLFGILTPDLSFSDFVNRLAKIPDHLKDQHLKPQHLFLWNYDQKNITVQVLKLEEPEKLSQFLNQKGLEFKHLNKSNDSYDYRAYYNTNTFHKVEEIYRTDIERFGYESDKRTLGEYVKTVQK